MWPMMNTWQQSPNSMCKKNKHLFKNINLFFQFCCFIQFNSISGPNTWQEWSKEGRRPYPLLPRVAPQTALSFIANSVSERVSAENKRLPFPSETGEVIKAEQLQMERAREDKSVLDKQAMMNYVVTTEPVRLTGQIELEDSIIPLISIFLW